MAQRTTPSVRCPVLNVMLDWRADVAREGDTLLFPLRQDEGQRRPPHPRGADLAPGLAGAGRVPRDRRPVLLTSARTAAPCSETGVISGVFRRNPNRPGVTVR